jgi:hypothetical protein
MKEIYYKEREAKEWSSQLLFVHWKRQFGEREC